MEPVYFNRNAKDKIMGFAASCERFAYKLQMLSADDKRNENNTLLKEIINDNGRNVMAEMSRALAAEDHEENDALFERREEILEEVEARLNYFKQTLNSDDYTVEELSGFSINLGLRHSALNALGQCHNAMQNIDWNNLKANKF